MTTKTKEKALDTYISAHAKIEELLARLSEAAADHFGDNPDKINWGNVGDLQAIVNDLQHISDRVFKEGEYA